MTRGSEALASPGAVLAALTGVAGALLEVFLVAAMALSRLGLGVARRWRGGVRHQD
jgi:hypothetical protein